LTNNTSHRGTILDLAMSLYRIMPNNIISACGLILIRGLWTTARHRKRGNLRRRRRALRGPAARRGSSCLGWLARYTGGAPNFRSRRALARVRPTAPHGNRILLVLFYSVADPSNRRRRRHPEAAAPVVACIMCITNGTTIFL